MDDNEKLDEERKNYKQWKNRISGVSNSGSVGPTSNSFGGVTSSNYVSSNSNTNSKSTAKNDYDPTKFKKTEIKKNQISDSESDEENANKKKKKSKKTEDEEKPKKVKKQEIEQPSKPELNKGLFNIKNPSGKQKKEEDDEFEEVQENNDIFNLGNSKTNDNNTKINNQEKNVIPDIFGVTSTTTNSTTNSFNPDIFSFTTNSTNTSKPQQTNVIDFSFQTSNPIKQVDIFSMGNQEAKPQTQNQSQSQNIQGTSKLSTEELLASKLFFNFSFYRNEKYQYR